MGSYLWPLIAIKCTPFCKDKAYKHIEAENNQKFKHILHLKHIDRTHCKKEKRCFIEEHETFVGSQRKKQLVPSTSNAIFLQE